MNQLKMYKYKRVIKINYLSLNFKCRDKHYINNWYDKKNQRKWNKLKEKNILSL